MNQSPTLSLLEVPKDGLSQTNLKPQRSSSTNIKKTFYFQSDNKLKNCWICEKWIEATFQVDIEDSGKKEMMDKWELN